jgi:fermentation-respiration switch protein FrsA (DUF1100 family)
VNGVVRMVLALAAGYAAILALVFVLQPKLVYFPMKGSYSITPQARSLAFERVTLATADGENIAAWWIPAPAVTPVAPARGSVLLFHGNAGTIEHRLDYALMFGAMGYHTLLVDYRGYGESSGTPSEAGTYQDAQASWLWLTQTRGVAPSDIVIFGESLGGGVATWLAAQYAQQKPRALILASTFTSIPDLGAEIYPWLPVRWLSRIHYNNLANLTRITAPLLVAHSAGDEIIPYAHGRRLHAAAQGPKAFLEMHGGHNEGFVFARPEWTRALQVFLARYAEK